LSSSCFFSQGFAHGINKVGIPRGSQGDTAREECGLRIFLVSGSLFVTVVEELYRCTIRKELSTGSIWSIRHLQSWNAMLCK
jgi:hypothetical protein